MSSRSGRAVSATNGMLAFGLVALLAGVALVVNPPAPPGIAEFAPQASKPITKGPVGQAAAGRGPADCPGCTAGATPRPSPLSSGLLGDRGRGVPSALQCYTWPDGSVTQTFDPQSPPCIATWARRKGNGGATSSGVSATEIRVALPDYGGSYYAAAARDYATFINAHFQLYGRRVVIAPVPGRHSQTAQEQRAIAAAVRSVRPFAALALSGPGNDSAAYETAVIEGQILVVRAQTVEGAGPEASGHFWTYNPLIDQVERNLASFLCTSLPPGATARYAGATERAPRKYAVLRHTYPDGSRPADVRPLVDGLAACDGKPDVEQVEYQPYNPAQPNTQYQMTLQAMRGRGVTSVIVFGGRDFAQMTQPMTAASSLGYLPEWVDPGLTYFSDADNVSGPFGGAPKEQLEHLLGITPLSKPLPRLLRPALKAYQEIRPGIDPTDTVGRAAFQFYEQLLLIASGIQAAGPQLTAQTFEAGLQSLEFPNPGAGANPSYQASVGFGEGHTMVRDYAVWSWDNSRRDVDAGPGSTTGTRCYAERGKRWRLGTWPSRPIPLFQPNAPC